MQTRPARAKSISLHALTVLLLLIGPQVSTAQSKLWGTTLIGGTNNLGVVYTTNSDGSNLTLRKEFQITSSIKGVSPYGNLIQDAGGLFYGVAAGGTKNGGILYKVDITTGTFTILHDFGTIANDGLTPNTPLIASDGKIYGTTSSGGIYSKNGTLYRYDPSNGNYSVIHSFGGSTDGQLPFGSLNEVSGKLYGVTALGNPNAIATIFQYDIASSTYTKKLDIGSDIDELYSEMTLASNGNLYGMTSTGGVNGSGFIFEYVPGASTITVKFDFEPTSGSSPYGTLCVGSNNLLYALTFQEGANQYGTILEFNPATGSVLKKYDFNKPGGIYPLGTMVTASNGKMYGTTSEGGTYGKGVFFEFDPTNGAYTEKVNFNGANGSRTRMGKPMLAANNKIYGVTGEGGNTNYGVLFEFDPPTGILTPVFNFGSISDGYFPTNSLAQAFDGTFYGITENGGLQDRGVIYKIDPQTFAFTKVADFNGAPSAGETPVGPLILNSNGNFYGMTLNGGAEQRGTIYEFNPSSNELSTVYHFGVSVSGNQPFGGLAEYNGKYYGITRAGGANDLGTIFEFDPVTHAFQVKVNFDNALGGNATGTLTLAPNNKFYGVNRSKGLNNKGTLFEFDPATGTATKMVDFGGGSNPSSNQSSLTLAGNGKLYSVTFSGGATDHGCIYEYVPAATTVTVKYSFLNDVSTGTAALGSMVLSDNGKLYGTPSSGGINMLGTLFEFDPSTGAFTKKYDFDNTHGEQPWRGAPTLEKAPQTITFNAIGGRTYGSTASFQLTTASASSGLPITYTSSDPGIVTISGTTATIVAPGTITITAFQNGDISHLPARSKTQTLTISPGSNIITFNSIPTKEMADPPFTLSATATSALPVVFSSSSDKISISGSTITLIKPGKVNVIGSQPGNGFWGAATNVTQSFCINPSKPVITSTSATVLSSSIADNYQWYFQGSAIPGATGQTLPVTQSGSYTVQTSSDACLSAMSDAKSVLVTGDLNPEQINFVAYPNPATNKVTVTLPNDGNKKLITVFNVSGQQLDYVETFDKEIIFDLDHYIRGLYLMKIASESSQHFIRFEKQ